ncbi:hypothetical protein QTP86_002029, partial [Hemibagrus guttatus]
PVCEQATEPALFRAPKVHRDQMTEAVEFITKPEKERFNLIHQVKTLQDKVKDMENQLCDTLLQCEREQEAHSHLKSEYHEMMETLTNNEKLLKECEREQEAHRLLKSEYHMRIETLTNNEKSLKVSLAEAEEKHQKAVETITQLEEERTDLTDQVKTLRDTVEDMGNQLCDTLLQCDELKNVSLSEAEEKHQKAVETITQLEQEKSNLTGQVKKLRNAVESMGNQLGDTHLQCDELKNECEREQEAHRLLKSEYHMRIETLTNNEKSLKKPGISIRKKKRRLLVPVNIWDSDSSSESN